MNTPPIEISVMAFTIGHSTRTLEEFIDLLKIYSVEHVADIRTIPRSRHNPQFNQDSLPMALEAKGIRVYAYEGIGRSSPYP